MRQNRHYHLYQGRIQPVGLGGEILVIFGSQVSLRVHYCKSDEVYFMTLLWQNNGRQNVPISRMLFSELFKIMVKKKSELFKIMVKNFAFVGFRGSDRPPWILPWILYCISHNVFLSKDNSLSTWKKHFQVYCSWQYHKTDFSSFQSLTARHRNANNILSKMYLKYCDFKK